MLKNMKQTRITKIREEDLLQVDFTSCIISGYNKGGVAQNTIERVVGCAHSFVPFRRPFVFLCLAFPIRFEEIDQDKTASTIQLDSLCKVALKPLVRKDPTIYK